MHHNSNKRKDFDFFKLKACKLIFNISISNPFSY